MAHNSGKSRNFGQCLMSLKADVCDGRSIPQGLKPAIFEALFGTTEVVPFRV
jgi:hypothetical protein